MHVAAEARNRRHNPRMMGGVRAGLGEECVVEHRGRWDD